MRIAQVSPLHESVPPKLYGGTERVVSYLTEALGALGHDVTLYASSDSKTSTRLAPDAPPALRLSGVYGSVTQHVAHIERVRRDAHHYDFIHFHTDPFHYAVARQLSTPSVTTLHGRLDISELTDLYRVFSDIPLISISNHQRRPLPDLAWQGTVYHGLPTSLYHQGPGTGGYLLFLGRISPEKRADRAIEIARRARLPLKIAAKVDPADRVYFDECIRPLLREPWIEHVGEVSDEQKQALLGDALGLLFPVDWPEPFGLVTVEAMACGTPVIAWRQGAVPEILEEGVTGFIVNDTASAVHAVARLETLDRAEIRRTFERRFSSERMARDYLTIYEQMMHTATAAGDASRSPPLSLVEGGRP